MEENNLTEEKITDDLFEIAVFIKFVFGIFEILGGILFAIAGQKIVDNIILFMAQSEVADDPSDFIRNYLVKFAASINVDRQIFAEIYLLAHGLINIVLALALIKNKLWAFPFAIAGFGSFIVYQIYKYFHTYSWTMLVLTILDICIVMLIWFEYKKKMRYAKR